MISVSAVSANAASVVSTLQQSWGTNGRVSAILADPGTGRVYVAGNFTAVTDSTGMTTQAISNVAAFLPASGTFDANWHPNPNGPVNALALSGGQLYLGGNFTQVGGQATSGLAAVTSTTGAVQSWAPRVSGGVVAALAVNGGSIFVGGNFTSLAGTARPFLGRVSLSTGALDSTFAPTVSARVRSLVVSGDGARLYVGGDFATINGSTAAKSIASLSTSTGALTTGFNAGATSSGAEPPAVALYLDGGNLLAAVAGSGGGCASLSASTGKTQWSKQANGNMQAVTAMGGTVYCGGHFSGSGSFDGLTRYKLAAVDEASGSVLSFAPRINSALGVWALDHDATQLYLGGDFTKVNRKDQPHFAVFK
jgi:hypothetical protein